MKRFGAGLLGFALAAASVVGGSAARAEVRDDPGGDEGPDRGFYLGLSAVGTSYSLDLDDRAAATIEGFEFDELGLGAEVFCGVMLGPRFRLEFAGAVTVHDATPGDAKMAVTGARITGYLPLVAGRAIEPSLLAGLGASGVVFAGEDFDNRFYAAVRGDLGAGLRVRVTRHQFLQMHFLYSVHDVEREFVNIDDDEDEVDIRHVGGQAWSRTAGLGWGWDF